MICSNGKQITPKGETGIYFICLKGKHEGNHCRYVRWCKQTNQYVMITKPDGSVCVDFTTSVNEI